MLQCKLLAYSGVGVAMLQQDVDAFTIRILVGHPAIVELVEMSAFRHPYAMGLEELCRRCEVVYSFQFLALVELLAHGVGPVCNAVDCLGAHLYLACIIAYEIRKCGVVVYGALFKTDMMCFYHAAPDQFAPRLAKLIAQHQFATFVATFITAYPSVQGIGP